MGRLGKSRSLAVSFGVVIMLIIVAPFVINSIKDRTTQASAINPASPGLGITYLPVTRVVSGYYELGVNYGALVTDVAPGSPAYDGGVRPGDIIISFNGTALGDDASLLQMMMSYSSGDMVTLEFLRDTESYHVSLALNPVMAR